jgi:hypothetical protein
LTKFGVLRTGAVLLYPVLWSREYGHGEDSSRKNRPVAVVFNFGNKIGLVPVTTKLPQAGMQGIDVPDAEKLRAGLDVSIRLWVIPTEMNIDDPGNSYYLEPQKIIGQFSIAFMEKLKAEIRHSLTQLKQVPRR